MDELEKKITEKIEAQFRAASGGGMHAFEMIRDLEATIEALKEELSETKAQLDSANNPQE